MAFNFKLSISKRYSRHAFLAKLSEMMICHYPRPGPGKSPTSSRFFGMWSSMSAFLALVSRAARAQCSAVHMPTYLTQSDSINHMSTTASVHCQTCIYTGFTWNILQKRTQEARDASPRWASARAVSNTSARHVAVSR